MLTLTLCMLTLLYYSRWVAGTHIMQYARWHCHIIHAETHTMYADTVILCIWHCHIIHAGTRIMHAGTVTLWSCHCHMKHADTVLVYIKPADWCHHKTVHADLCSGHRASWRGNLRPAWGKPVDQLRQEWQTMNCHKTWTWQEYCRWRQNHLNDWTRRMPKLEDGDRSTQRKPSWNDHVICIHSFTSFTHLQDSYRALQATMPTQSQHNSGDKEQFSIAY